MARSSEPVLEPNVDLDFDFGFEDDETAYDPFFDDGEDGTSTGNGQEPQDFPAPAASQEPEEAPAPQAPPADTRPAAELTAELFEEMAPHRRELLGVLRATLEPRSAAEVASEVARLQENARSVYNAANLTSLLERAGSLQKVDGEGAPVDRTRMRPPETVRIDGHEYWKPAPRRSICWLATDTGRAMVEADCPLERLQDLFEEEPEHVPVYRRVLDLCSAPEGIAIRDIGSQLDSDPALGHAHLYAARFVDRLESCEAIEWTGTWHITDIGRQGLALLSTTAETGGTCGEKGGR